MNNTDTTNLRLFSLADVINFVKIYFIKVFFLNLWARVFIANFIEDSLKIVNIVNSINS